MTETLTIARIGHRGDGIADTPGGAAYVPFTLPGETVTVQPVPGHPDRRHLLSIEAASAERIEPVCPHFGVCGGCATQHWSAAPYLQWKRQLVIDALARAGIAAEVEPIIDAHGAGRRRAVFHARQHGGNVLEVGYMAARSHTIVPIDRCPILAPGLDGAISAAWAVAEALRGVKKPLDIQVTATAGGIDMDIRGSGALEASRTTVLARLAEKHRIARITHHGELVTQIAPPALTMGRALVTLPPGSFLQATEQAEDILAKLVVQAAGKAKHIADLFCGVGPFALRLADKARVTAADSDEGAIDALTKAATSTSGLKPISAQARDLFRRPMVPLELNTFDAVVFDPPRQGAEAQVRELAKSKVPAVIAVSCDAATFARDARILIEGGYRIGPVTPVDQFRYSHHVEIVAKFIR